MHRREIRRLAQSNLILRLLDEAARSGGRLHVESYAEDAILLGYRDVRTLVRRGRVYEFASRDCAVVVAMPEDWPFRRKAMLRPILLHPEDFAHPNSDGHLFCIDTAGVRPARLPGLVYQNLALWPGHFRLDHCVDRAASDFVRAHLKDLPADPRPLVASEGRP
jgi:hypothetical protein